MATVLKLCRLGVIDESTMLNKQSLEALDRTLKDLRGINEPMGGALILLSGDFRQTLPVIRRSTPADELNACLKSSYLWKYVRKIQLTTNMRVHMLNDRSAEKFSRQLLDIGDGKLQIHPESKDVSFEQDFCRMVTSVKDLIQKVFPNILENYKNHEWLFERAILAPTNEDVHKINYQIQLKIPGSTTKYKSIDTVTKDEEAVHFPTEFLNSLEPAGMPPHILNLKVGSVVMVIRNLNPPFLCNGTRVVIKRLTPNLIEATILGGRHKGTDVFIPRIPMISIDLPFEFKRLQFPVRLAFAFTINKGQGQTLKVAGLDLSKPCFSHGQLYVGCSRVGTPKNLYIYTPNGRTKNIVYPIALK